MSLNVRNNCRNQAFNPYLPSFEYVPDMEPTLETITADRETPVQYVANIKRGTEIGYKYFEFKQSKLTNLMLRGKTKGFIRIFATDGEYGLMFQFASSGTVDLQSFTLVGG